LGYIVAPACFFSPPMQIVDALQKDDASMLLFFNPAINIFTSNFYTYEIGPCLTLRPPQSTDVVTNICFALSGCRQKKVPQNLFMILSLKSTI
jgi:hypothetical protein